MKKIYLGSAVIAMTLIFGVFQNCSSGSLPANATNAASSTNAVAPTLNGCMLDNQTVDNGTIINGYYVNTVGAGAVCPAAAQLTCANGIWSGGTPATSTGLSTGSGSSGSATSLLAYSTCAGPTSCSINGATVANGSNVSAYSATTVATGVLCSTVEATLSCSNGAVTSSSGSASNFIYSSCTPTAFSGTWTNNGGWYTEPLGYTPYSYDGVARCPIGVSTSAMACTSQNATCWATANSYSDSYNSYYPRFRCK